QYHLNSSTTTNIPDMHMSMYPGYSDMDFTSLSLPKNENGDFSQKRLPPGTTAMQTNLMRCVAYGLSTDRLTPDPFNLCSNAGNTHVSIFKKQPLDMTQSTSTQLLWSTMVRPVLSGTSCQVK
ncbi:hypothetical protein ATANTOWER_012840, partial [Ataeniobius toweri]|nr:hypothetical protein [Ataeniobius toweri]